MNACLCVPVPYSVCYPGPSICLQSWYFHFSSQTTIALCIITTFIPPSHVLMDIVTFFHVVAIEIRRAMNMNEHSPVKVDFQSGRAVMTFIWQVISFTQLSSFHKVVLWATDVPALKVKNLDWMSLTTYSCSNISFPFPCQNKGPFFSTETMPVFTTLTLIVLPQPLPHLCRAP